MVTPIYLQDNKPFPNNSLPVLFYENVLEGALGTGYSSQEVQSFFEKNGYTNSWIAGILERHHFHSTAHEVLACTRGEVQVQLGGPHGEIVNFRKGDVVLLPAGVSHKRLDATENFQIVGAYPHNDSEYDFQYGDANDYERIKDAILKVKIPLTDPVTGSPGAVGEFWRK